MALLRDILRMSLSPLWNNICCTLLMLLYVKASMEGAIWIKNVLKHNRKLHAQQLVHVALSSCLMFWPLYDPSDWSWRLNVLVPAVLATRLLFKVRHCRGRTAGAADKILFSSSTFMPHHVSCTLLYKQGYAGERSGRRRCAHNVANIGTEWIALWSTPTFASSSVAGIDQVHVGRSCHSFGGRGNWGRHCSAHWVASWSSRLSYAILQ